MDGRMERKKELNDERKSSTTIRDFNLGIDFFLCFSHKNLFFSRTKNSLCRAAQCRWLIFKDFFRFYNTFVSICTACDSLAILFLLAVIVVLVTSHLFASLLKFNIGKGEKSFELINFSLHLPPIAALPRPHYYTPNDFVKVIRRRFKRRPRHRCGAYEPLSRNVCEDECIFPVFIAQSVHRLRWSWVGCPHNFRRRLFVDSLQRGYLRLTKRRSSFLRSSSSSNTSHEIRRKCERNSLKYNIKFPIRSSSPRVDRQITQWICLGWKRWMSNQINIFFAVSI